MKFKISLAKIKDSILGMSTSTTVAVGFSIIALSSFYLIYPTKSITDLLNTEKSSSPSLTELEGELRNLCKSNIPVNYTIATGSEFGSYYKFAENLGADLPECMTLTLSSPNEGEKGTKGTKQNLDLLEQSYSEGKHSKYSLAILQSDMFYNYEKKIASTKSGDDPLNFFILMPIFEEFVQIYTNKYDGDKNYWLGDLKNKVIYPGSERSGTFKNATDFNQSIGIKLETKLSKGNNNSCELFESKEIDAAFYTGNDKLSCKANKETLSLVHVPEKILQTISDQNAGQYSITSTPSHFNNEKKGNTENKLLSVRALLAVSKNLSEHQERFLPIFIKTMINKWHLLSKNPFPLDKILNKGNFYKIDSRAEKILINGNHSKKPNSESLWLLIWVALSFIIYRVNHNNITYNRLGDINYKKGITGLSRYIGYRLGDITQIISLILIFISFVTVIIQFAEQIQNPSSEFTNKSMLDLMLWTFTFMASGFNNDIYPASAIAQVTIAVLAAVGLIGPFFVILKVVDKVKDRDKSRRRGELAVNYSNHVLICGWNEKVPGILYCLTCDDAPEKKKVVVIAETDDIYPLDKYEFNKQYVEYYRGDSTDRNTLKNVNADKAAIAIIVAGYKKRNYKNITSVLTGLSLKKFNPNIFIASELLYRDNEVYFNSVESNAIIDFEIVSVRLLSLSVFNNHVVDFLLDLLTYDKHSKIYSISMQDIKKSISSTNRKIDIFSDLQKSEHRQDIINHLLCNGVNIIGFSKNKHCEMGVINKTFESSDNVAPIISPKNVNFCVGATGAIVYLASEKNDILTEKNIFTPQPLKKLEGIEINKPFNKKVIIVSEEKEKSNILKSEIEGSPFETCITIINRKNESGKINDSELLETIRNNGETVTIILLSPSGSRVNNMQQDQGQIDADTILLSKIIRNVFPDKKTRIHAELLNSKNRYMLEAAGADVIICECTFVERILTKLAYSKGIVTDFLVSLLDTTGKTLLYNITVDKKSDFIGVTYSELWYTPFKGGRLIACIPKSRKESLQNIEGDFFSHYITSPFDIGSDFIEEGDQLILMIDTVEIGWR